jgi:class 3 adenylate cyclase
LAKYQQLAKIKLIGDIYIAAGGLFAEDAALQGHAGEMIQFTLEVLKIIDDVNVKLNALLAVRIRVNPGGLILGGVLGTDKPTFHINCDPINIAPKAQSTGIAGRVHVAEDTYKHTSDMPVPTEHRRVIELKGKGKKQTYIVMNGQEPTIGHDTSF